MQPEFSDIAEEAANVMPAVMSFPIPDICTQYLGEEIKSVVSKSIPVEELTQISLAGNNSTQAIIESQTGDNITPCTRDSSGNSVQHSIRMYSTYVK